MEWILVERKPDVIYAGRLDFYLAADDAHTLDPGRARVFETREAAEAHRRKLKHPYDWVSMTRAKETRR